MTRFPRNYNPPGDLLADRVILITGAGQGIGRSVALACAAHGATVVLHGRRMKKLEAVYEEIERSSYPEPMIVALDLAAATDAEFERLAGTIGTELARLDGIVHCAAQFEGLRPLADLSLNDWMASLRVNIAAAACLNRACQPLLSAAPDAAVIVTGETHGDSPQAFWGAFACAKAALRALVRVQSEEWQQYPALRINLLVPGPVRSPQRSRSHPAESPERLAAPDELMSAFLYFIGPDSRGRSGETINCHD